MMRRRSSRSRRRSLRVEIGQRLVEQQELRLVDEAARQRDALHLAAGERDHRPLGDTPTSPTSSSVSSTLRSMSARGDAAMAQRIGDVLPHRHVRPHRVGLEHHADVALARRHQHAVGRRRHQPCRRSRCVPAVGVLETGDAAQRRGLAAAGRAEQHDDLARRDVEADVVDRGRPVANSLRNSRTIERQPTSRNASLPIAVGLVPLLDPVVVQLHVLLEVRHPDLDHLGIEARRIERRLLRAR